FVLSGGLGGLVGLVLLEAVAQQSQGVTSWLGKLEWMGIYFGGFGLAVGAALGMTEGIVQKNRRRTIYGLAMGLVLGAIGGGVGGALGQAIYGLAPLRYASQSKVDLAVALDSSGSMRELYFFGNDPHGERRKAAKDLAGRLSPTDRLAVIDFDSEGKVVYPLTTLASDADRDAAKRAIDQVDDSGGTNLSAGIDAAVGELVRNKREGRSQFVIFLTDGQGYYDTASAERARQAGIIVYTVGLGKDVSADLLTSIAQQTGGKYYPVENASALSMLFEKIFTENIGMATAHGSGAPPQGAKPLTSPWILILFRILGWAAVGLAIGAGQGVRENTREDLLACSLGGLIGGALGGALFDPLSSLVSIGAGLVGRGIADVVVGACIGGSMRLAQEKIVEASGKPTTTLLAVLPPKGGLVALPEPAGPPQKPAPTPVVFPRPVAAPPLAPTRPAPAAPVTAAPAAVAGPSLAEYQKKYADRSQAMAMAYRSGVFSLREIGQHFGVPSTAVKRAAEQYAGR
ncbi:MAG TPA: vWA domain-containing protein, partial [Thermoanaerobaculia bacterium]|nr:vWA domain-containing protein [Thermoanaerobaculia bacterium]